MPSTSRSRGRPGWPRSRCWRRSGCAGGWTRWTRSTTGRPPRRHEVVEPLAATIQAGDLPRRLFQEAVAARVGDAELRPHADRAALELYIDHTAGHLMELAARHLGAEGAALPVVRDFARGAGTAALLRALPELRARGRDPLPAGGGGGGAGAGRARGAGAGAAPSWPRAGGGGAGAARGLAGRAGAAAGGVRSGGGFPPGRARGGGCAGARRALVAGVQRAVVRLVRPPAEWLGSRMNSGKGKGLRGFVRCTLYAQRMHNAYAK